MDLATVLPIVTAIGVGIGAGVVGGLRFLGRQAVQKPDLMNPRLTDSGRWPGLDQMCPAHSILVDGVREARDAANKSQLSSAAAAQAASLAAQGISSLDKSLRETDKSIQTVLSDLREWKGKQEQKVESLTKEVDDLQGRVLVLGGTARMR